MIDLLAPILGALVLIWAAGRIAYGRPARLTRSVTRSYNGRSLDQVRRDLS